VEPGGTLKKSLTFLRNGFLNNKNNKAKTKPFELAGKKYIFYVATPYWG
jgi:hypothetical protein